MADLERILKDRIERLRFIGGTIGQVCADELVVCLEIYEREKLVEQSEPSGDEINAI